MSETRLELQIVESSQGAIKGLDNLISALGRVQSAVGKGLNFSKAVSSLKDFSAAVAKAVPDDTVKKLERLGDALEKIRQNKTINLKINASTSDAQRKVKEVNDAIGAGNNAKNFGMTDAKSQADGLVESVKNAGDGAKEATSKLDQFKAAIRSLAGESKRSSGAISNFVKSFGRIVYYRMIRAAIKAITKGVKEGTENYRQYSKAIGGTFAKAMSNADNALLKMKNSIGAALAPALQMLIPYVIQVINWFIQLMNIINQFLALLRGQSTWSKATDVSAEALEKTKKGAKAAGKEIKNLLADWDELNIIQSESGGGVGGKTADDTQKYLSMFEEVGVFDEKIKSIVNWLKDNLDSILRIAKLVGAAFLGWKLHNAFQSTLGKLFIKIIGIAVAVYGAYKAYEALKDQFENGINWDNFTALVNAAAIAVAGLTAAFGLKGLGAGLAAFGLAGVASALNDIVTNGTASQEALEQLKLSAFAGGVGLSLLTGSWIFVLVGAVAAAAISIYQNKEKIVGYLKEHVLEISQFMQSAGDASIAVGAMLAMSGVSIAGGIGMIAAGLALKDIGQGLPDAVSGDVDNVLKNIAKIVGKDSMAIGALLVISGIGIKVGIAMLLAGVTALGYGAGEGEDILTYLQNAWKNVKEWITPLSLGMFAVGAILALTGVGIGVGLRMMALGAVGIGLGLATGTLLDDLKGYWAGIQNWAAPLSLGLFALGAVLAFSGIGVRIGIGMMVAGAAGVAAQYLSNDSTDLLSVLLETWTSIHSWATPIAAGSFVLGAILAFTGVGIGAGVAMMAAGAAGIAAEVATGDLLGTIGAAWDEISAWALPLAAGSFVLGAILALTGVGVGVGLAMMAVGAAGIAVEATTGDLLGTLEAKWEEIHMWATPLAIGSFALGAVLALTGVGIGVGLAMMAVGAAGIVAEATTGDLLGTLLGVWDEIYQWATPLAVGSFVLGAILAFTGVGIVPGIAMMAAGIAGMYAEAERSGLLNDLKTVWATIVEWSDVIALGSVALGAILVLTGVGIGAGLAMIVAGLATKPEGINWNKLKGKLEEVYNSISGWWNSTVQPAIDTVVTWVKTNIIDKITGFFDTLKSSVKQRVELIKTAFTLVWKTKIYPIVNWIDVHIIQPITTFFSSLWSVLTGDTSFSEFWDTLWKETILGTVNWIRDNITNPISGFFESVGRTVRRVFSWITGNGKYEELFHDFGNSTRQEIYKQYKEQYPDSHTDPIKMALAYEIDMNGGNAIELGSDLAKEVITGLMKTFSLDAEYVLEMLKEAFGWEYQDIVDLIDFSALDAEELEDVLSVLQELGLNPPEGIEYELDVDESSFDVSLPAPDTSAFSEGFAGAAQSVIDSVSAVTAAVQSLDGMSFAFSWDSPNGGTFSVTQPKPVAFAAEGGMFTAGEMFVAREAGPEMVGRMGTRSTVANNDQIVAGIAGGVAAGQAEQNNLLRQQNDYLRRLLEKESTVRVQPSTAWGEFTKKSSDMYARATGRG